MWFRFSLSVSVSLKFRRSCCRILCECVFVCSFVYLRQRKRLARFLALKNVRFCELHFVSVFFFFFFSHAWLPYGCFLFVCQILRIILIASQVVCWDVVGCFVFCFWCLATSENFGFLPSVVNPLCQREKSCPQNNLLLFFSVRHFWIWSVFMPKKCGNFASTTKLASSGLSLSLPVLLGCSAFRSLVKPQSAMIFCMRSSVRKASSIEIRQTGHTAAL